MQAARMDITGQGRNCGGWQAEAPKPAAQQLCSHTQKLPPPHSLDSGPGRPWAPAPAATCDVSARNRISDAQARDPSRSQGCSKTMQI